MLFHSSVFKQFAKSHSAHPAKQAGFASEVISPYKYLWLHLCY